MFLKIVGFCLPIILHLYILAALVCTAMLFSKKEPILSMFKRQGFSDDRLLAENKNGTIFEITFGNMP